jgi:subtilisin-like proprotein convertase family protein
VVVSNSQGVVTSVVAILTVSTNGLPPGIVTPPQSQTVAVGANAAFTVTAGGTEPLRYQWRFNSVNLAGATTNSYTRTNAQVSDAGSYDVVVTNAAGAVTSAVAVLTVTIPCPAAGLQNASFEGGNIGGVATSWTAYEVNSPTIKVWSIQTVSPPEGSQYQQIQAYNAEHTASAGVRQNVTGCIIGATYQITGWYRSNSDDGRARVRVSPGGSTDWSTAVDLNPVAEYGSGTAWATFSGTVVATGTNMTLWLDGRTVSGTSAKVGCFDAVTVTCEGMPVQPPSITTPPQSQTVNEGADATFTVTAGGTAPLIYQWRFNGVDVGGATATSYTRFSAQPADAGSYDVVVTNVAGAITSAPATLTVTNPCAPTALVNGDFEGGTNANGVATGWTGYQRAPDPTTTWSIKTASPPTGGGLQYQQIVNTSSTGGGGVRQDISGCAVGATYSIGGWMRGNSASATCTVKVSPTASTDWSTAVDLDPPQIYTGSTWTPFSGTVVATGPSMTLWLDGQTGGIGLDKAECFDSVTVVCVDGQKPIITQQPAATNLCAGGTAMFSVAATGQGTLSYQWQTNGVNISNGSHYAGCTNTTLWVTNVTAGDVVSYRCVVTDDNGSSHSSEAALTLKAAPAVTSQPAAQNVCAGAIATFSLTATGGGTLTYQWQTNNVNLSNGSHYSGCTNAALWVTNVSGADTVNYRCVVSGDCGVITSSIAGLTLKSATAITGQPSGQNVCSGVNVSFGVTASGDGTLTYQWQTNSVNLSNGGHYSGCTNATLWVTNVTGADATSYRCVVTAGCGSVNSSTAGLTVKAATTVTGQPTPQNVCSGSNPSFTVTASGDGTLIYQWQTNGVNLSNNNHYGGVATATLTVTNAGSTDAVNYLCVVSGGCGSANSSGVALTVKAATAITGQPSAQNVCSGANATFSVTASGDGVPAYQWQTNGVNLSDSSHYGGSATGTLWVTNVSSVDAVNYRCVVSGGCGSTNSAEAALTLSAPTAITGQPSAQDVCAGSNASFNVTATGGMLTYQWQTNGVNVSSNSHYGGCRTATLWVTNVSSSDVVNYGCVVSGGCGSVTSSAPVLTVRAATAISQQPSGQAVSIGGTANFSVAATGEGTLMYQWRKNGGDLTNGGHYSGVTTATLTVSATDSGDVGGYSCVVSGGCGSVTSSSALLSLLSTGLFSANYTVNRAVPDGGFIGISDTRVVSTALHSVTNVRVRLKISGTYNGDLFCYVTHGSGYSVLLNRVGRTANSAFGYEDPGMEVTFEDGATNDVHDYRLTVTGNHSIPLGTNLMGNWVADGRTNRPSEVLDTDARPALLSGFTGLDPNGNWTVFVADVGAGDSHTLVSWGLEISGTEEPPGPTVATINGQVKLQAYLGSSRMVRFIASAVAGGVTNYLQTNDAMLSFSGGEASYSIEVPTNTTHVSAKTAWHLRKRQAVTFVNGAATNNFTGIDWLLGGDLVTAIGSTSIADTDNLVNAVDLGLLLGYYLNVVGSDLMISRADIDGDGVVDMVNAVDLSILLGNYLLPGDGP